MASTDVVVIGGGIAGAAVACELTLAGCSVVLVEREPQLAHHTTGRSASIFLESYGPPPVRALTRASRPMFAEAIDRLGTPPLLHPRPSLWLADEAQLGELEQMMLELPGLERLDEAGLVAMAPEVRLDRCAAAAAEPDSADIDVLGLHQGYVRTARAAGLRIDHTWPVTAIERAAAGGFTVRAAAGPALECGAVVVAAGAWSDEVAAYAGARPLGLQPMRRTVAICRTTSVLSPDGPLVGDAGHTYYWKAEGPNVLCSPADETPSEPCDSRPEEEAVALGIERVNDTTTLALRSVITTWAGLRTFAPDRVPVCGEDPEVPGLWWSAGQGGYGIQTAPAMALVLAAAMTGRAIPEQFIAAGVDVATLAPARFRS